MTVDVICTKCDTDFTAEEWHNGVCPNCGAHYCWDECGENENTNYGWVYPVFTQTGEQ